ncbi:MAG TPA: T9SS type A sorting domain-containing protein [Chitinophagales bacterium]|nr:T9SS type A sorting domain-containing protein [Chitinophagales bacterium]
MKYKNLFLLSCLTVLACGKLFSQNPDILWSKTYGGSNSEEVHSILQTSDGGFIVCGYSQSNDGDVIGNNGDYDAWVLKLNAEGEISWQKTYGGSWSDFITVIKQTEDGYILSGETGSNDGDIVGNHGGGADAWILKIDTSGLVQWSKCFGGSQADVASDIQICPNGDFIFVGFAQSTDGDLTSNFLHGATDTWVVKLDSLGDIIWSQLYGGTGFDQGTAIYKTKDNGYIISSVTTEGNGDVSNSNYHNSSDYWLFKIDSIGMIEWSKCFGGNAQDSPSSVMQTDDGGYIIDGSSQSDDGDVTNHHGSSVYYDYWIVKTDSAGNLIWQKSLGGTVHDICNSITLSADSGLLLIGYTSSSDGDVTYNHSIYPDAWIVKLDNSGTLQWQSVYGGSDIDEATSLIQLNDGSYVFAGGSFSNDYDLSLNQGLFDYWIVKLSAATLVTNVISDTNYLIFPNPSSGIIFFNNRDNLSGIIEVTDALGKIIYFNSYTPSEKRVINLSDYPRGIYFLRIENNNTFSIEKIILE